jgi:hypothetical protein
MTGPVIQLDQFTSLLTEVEAEPRLARRFARVPMSPRTFMRQQDPPREHSSVRQYERPS